MQDTSQIIYWGIGFEGKIGVFAKNTLALLSLSQVKAKIHFGSCVQVGKCEPEPVATLSSGSWGSGRELIWSGHFGGTDRWRMLGYGKGVQEEVPLWNNRCGVIMVKYLFKSTEDPAGQALDETNAFGTSDKFVCLIYFWPMFFSFEADSVCHWCSKSEVW